VTAIPRPDDRRGSHWLRVELLAPNLAPRAARPKRTRWLAAAVLAFALLAVAALTGAEGSAESKAVPVAKAAVPALVAGDVQLVALVPSFERWGRVYRVPVDLLEALAWRESRWQAGARSEAGAIGIGQLMPSTVVIVAGRIRKPLDPWRPADNIRLMARFLSDLLKANHGDERGALAEYAQGSPSVATVGATPQTARYVEEIIRLRAQFAPVHT
jgi:soluble lytic murein transglycosylase-like protein